MIKSHPSRVCGLKFALWVVIEFSYLVAPFAGVWIEMASHRCQLSKHEVAPFAGVWIEIRLISSRSFSGVVAPFAGVWIEINLL